MTTYGTIPSESLPQNLAIISNAQERIKSSLGARRPWDEMFQLQSLSLPEASDIALQRIRTNAAFFRTNYVIIFLFILFLSLLWHPVSLIVFIIMMAAWLFLYFLREDPLMIAGIVIQDRVAMIFLLMATIILLFLTNVSGNIIFALSMAVLVISVHGALRNTDDLILMDVEDRLGPLGSATLSRGGGGDNMANVPLKNAASTSFSA